MTTFLQTASGDLALSAVNKNLQIVTDPNQQAAQKLRNLFLSFLGEWAFDVRIGVPYFQVVFVKNPNTGILRQIFREVILSVPWIVQVNSINIAITAKRELDLTFSCTTQSGAIITGGTGVPFIVTIPQGASS